jgi:hypothetical protein
MTELFNRRFRVSIGKAGAFGKSIENPLQIKFELEKTGTLKPNHGYIELYNLAPDTRSYIDNIDLDIILEAGYESSEQFGLIFKGKSTLINHITDDLTKITRVEIKDSSAKQVSNSVLSLTFSEDTTEEQVIKKVIKELAIDKSFIMLTKYLLVNDISSQLDFLKQFGDKEKIVPDATEIKVKKQKITKEIPVILDESTKQKNPQQAKFNKGRALSGPTIKELQLLLAGNGLWGWITDGALNIVPYGVSISVSPIFVSNQRGLIGSPERTEKGIKFTSLLNNKLNPGVLIELASLEIRGQYVIVNVKQNGDYEGSDWYSHCECVAFNP